MSSLASAATLNKSEFTEYFLNSAKTVTNLSFIVYGPLDIHSKDVNGFKLITLLDNAYMQYQASPKDIDTIIARHITEMQARRVILSVNHGMAIRAVIKPISYLETMKGQLKQSGVVEEDSNIVYRKLNEELLVFYVFDTQSEIRMLTKKDLIENHIDEKVLAEVAADNISLYFTVHGVIARLEKVGNAKIYKAYLLDDSYLASILLVKRYWSKKTLDVEGDILAFVPARDVVLITGSEDAEGKKIAESIAANHFKEHPDAISPKGYIYQNGAWNLYKP
jgi:uncharacterized protein YtpQ (UPF0354 family)